VALLTVSAQPVPSSQKLQNAQGSIFTSYRLSFGLLLAWMHAERGDRDRITAPSQREFAAAGQHAHDYTNILCVACNQIRSGVSESSETLGTLQVHSSVPQAKEAPATIASNISTIETVAFPNAATQSTERVSSIGNEVLQRHALQTAQTAARDQAAAEAPAEEQAPSDSPAAALPAVTANARSLFLQLSDAALAAADAALANGSAKRCLERTATPTVPPGRTVHAGLAGTTVGAGAARSGSRSAVTAARSAPARGGGAMSLTLPLPAYKQHIGHAVRTCLPFHQRSLLVVLLQSLCSRVQWGHDHRSNGRGMCRCPCPCRSAPRATCSTIRSPAACCGSRKSPRRAIAGTPRRASPTPSSVPQTTSLLGCFQIVPSCPLQAQQQSLAPRTLQLRRSSRCPPTPCHLYCCYRDCLHGSARQPWEKRGRHICATSAPAAAHMRHMQMQKPTAQSGAKGSSGAAPPVDPVTPEKVMMLLSMVAQLAVFADGGQHGAWCSCLHRADCAPARALFRKALDLQAAGTRPEHLALLLQAQSVPAAHSGSPAARSDSAAPP
jgi:hypothetical protein